MHSVQVTSAATPPSTVSSPSAISVATDLSLVQSPGFAAVVIVPAAASASSSACVAGSMASSEIAMQPAQVTSEASPPSIAAVPSANAAGTLLSFVQSTGLAPVL